MNVVFSAAITATLVVGVAPLTLYVIESHRRVEANPSSRIADCTEDDVGTVRINPLTGRNGVCGCLNGATVERTTSGCICRCPARRYP